MKTKRTYGVELEFCGSIEAVEHILRIEKFNVWSVFGYSDEDPPEGYTTWTIKEDFSVKTKKNKKYTNCGYYESGMEICSPILHKKSGLKEIDRMCSILNYLQAKVNKTCGLHVHVAASDFNLNDIKTVIERYKKYEKIIDSWMEPSRRKNNNSYCSFSKNKIQQVNKDFIKSCDQKTFGDEALEIFSTSWEDIFNKYSKVNVGDCFQSMKTIEFRHHHGTLDSKEINNWIQFVVNFVDVSKKISRYGIRDYGPTMGLSPSIRKYYSNKKQKF